MKEIRVIIVDDQNLVQEGLEVLIQISEDMTVVAKANSGAPVLQLLKDHEPDVLLLDIRMPGMSGLEVLKQMQAEGVATPTLILTTFDDHDLVLECIQLGAKGYLRKDVRFDTLTKAVRSIAEGKTWYQPAVTCHAETDQSFKEWENAIEARQLTDIEMQVLRLVAAGYSNHEIATALHKSTGTVRNQVSSILYKLNTRDRTRAVTKALELGLI